MFSTQDRAQSVCVCVKRGELPENETEKWDRCNLHCWQVKYGTLLVYSNPPPRTVSIFTQAFRHRIELKTTDLLRDLATFLMKLKSGLSCGSSFQQESIKSVSFLSATMSTLVEFLLVVSSALPGSIRVGRYGSTRLSFTLSIISATVFFKKWVQVWNFSAVGHFLEMDFEL